MRWRTSETTSGQKTCNPIASNGRIQTDSAVHHTPWMTPAMTAALVCSATALGVTGASGTLRASRATTGVTAADRPRRSACTRRSRRGVPVCPHFPVDSEPEEEAERRPAEENAHRHGPDTPRRRGRARVGVSRGQDRGDKFGGHHGSMPAPDRFGASDFGELSPACGRRVNRSQLPTSNSQFPTSKSPASIPKFQLPTFIDSCGGVGNWELEIGS